MSTSKSGQVLMRKVLPSHPRNVLVIGAVLGIGCAAPRPIPARGEFEQTLERAFALDTKHADQLGSGESRAIDYVRSRPDGADLLVRYVEERAKRRSVSEDSHHAAQGLYTLEFARLEDAMRLARTLVGKLDATSPAGRLARDILGRHGNHEDAEQIVAELEATPSQWRYFAGPLINGVLREHDLAPRSLAALEAELARTEQPVDREGLRLLLSSIRGGLRDLGVQE